MYLWAFSVFEDGSPSALLHRCPTISLHIVVVQVKNNKAIGLRSNGRHTTATRTLESGWRCRLLSLRWCSLVFCIWYGMVWYGTVQSLCECHVAPRRGYLGSAHAVGSYDWRPARWLSGLFRTSYCPGRGGESFWHARGTTTWANRQGPEGGGRLGERVGEPTSVVTREQEFHGPDS